jgi:uncharacterized protein
MPAPPFHIFTSGGETYLHNVEGRYCLRVTESEAKAIRGIGSLSPDDGAFLSPYGLAEGDPAVTPGSTDVAVHSVTLLTTHACNFKCTYCYEFSNFAQPHSKPGRMKIETAKRTVDWLISTSGTEENLALGFFGGEPLLNFPLIEQTVDYANQQGAAHGKKFSFSLTTNGSLLSEEIIAFLKSHKIKTTISIDGGKEIQNAQRPMVNGKDSYETVRPRAAKLLTEMPETGVQATLCGDTDPRKVKADLAAIGFRKIGLTNVSPSTPEEGQKAGHGLWSARAMMVLLDDEAAALRQAIADRDADGIRTPYNYLCSRVGTFLTGQVKEHHCGAGKASVAVANSGDIYLCHRFADLKDYRLGHINDETIDRAAYQVKPVGSVAACSNCFSRYHCPGGCYHDNLNNTGSVFEPNETLCNVSRHMTELAAAISADLSDEDIAFLIAERLVPADARRRGPSRSHVGPSSPIDEAGLSGLASAIPAPWEVID